MLPGKLLERANSCRPFFGGREFERDLQVLKRQSERKKVSNYTQSADPRSNTDMKKFTVGAVFAAVSSTCAFAADLPMQAYKSAPVAAQVYNWTGLYVGVNGGYGWGTQDPLTLVSGRFDRASFDISGGMFGGTMGAQIQQGYVVIGLEGS